MRHDLTRLGAQEFEHLSQALAIAVLGGGVSVFGEGPDGGREATFDGLMNFPVPVPEGGQWNGHGVLQAKFKSMPTTTKADTAWFMGEVRKELRRWSDPGSSRILRGRKPDYLLFTTNVVLSSDPGRGGIDTFDELMRNVNVANKLGLKGWAVWHQDQMCRFLDVHDSVRRTYGGMTVTGDVLAEVQQALARLSKDQIPEITFSTLLTNQAAKELLAQQWVRLGQAGHATNQKLLLSEVAIDLPARTHSMRTAPGQEHLVQGVVAHIVRTGDAIRRPRPGKRIFSHLAIIGGPGQGKTTLGQLLCQVYRVALLADRPEHTLGPEVPGLLDAYRRHLDKLGIPIPVCRRWPLRIALNEFADVLADKPSTTLLEFAAEQSRRVGPINRLMLLEWLREWPWVVVLDGLDEVADPDIRETMLSAISEFFVDAGQAEADLLVVATTRPQGYRDEFSPRFYDHLTLLPMDPGNSVDYAEHLAAVRYAQDPELQIKVMERLKAAAAEPITARLMRTPLQITIMTLLLERRPRVPQDRHGLFESYYNTLYEREIAKDTPVSRLLDEQRRNIDRIHERVGLLLQIRAEHAGEAESLLPEDDLRRLAVERLVEEGNGPELAAKLADQLVKAATDRLVMLVGHPRSTIGFEVRSLQELMAARALFAADDRTLLRLLKELAQSAHWRNTWLFAASRLFAQREILRKDMMLMLEELDTDSPLSMYLTPGARLAIEMLDEDVAVNHPRFIKLLVRRALRLLDSYPGETMSRLAVVLNQAVSNDAALVHLGLQAIDAKISDRGKSVVTALDVLAAWADLPGNASVSAKSRVDKIKRKTPPELEEAIDQLKRFGQRDTWFPYYTPEQILEPASGAETLIKHIQSSGHDVPLQSRLIAVIRQLGAGGDLTDLDDSTLQELVVRGIGAFEPHQWPHAADIQRRLIHWNARRPINSEELLVLTTSVPTPRD